MPMLMVAFLCLAYAFAEKAVLHFFQFEVKVPR